MKTLGTLTIVMLLSWAASAPAAGLSPATTSTLAQQAASPASQRLESGRMDSIREGDVLTFPEGTLFRRDLLNPKRAVGPYVEPCRFEMTLDNGDSREIRLSRARQWTFTKPQNPPSRRELVSSDAPGKVLAMICHSPQENVVGSLSDSQFVIERPRASSLIAPANLEVMERGGAIFDGQTGDRPPRPRPGQR